MITVWRTGWRETRGNANRPVRRLVVQMRDDTSVPVSWIWIMAGRWREVEIFKSCV